MSSSSTSNRLPSPASRPDGDIVIYDGRCRFCESQVRNLYRLDWRGRLAFLSLHDGQVQQRWPELDHDRLMQEMVVVSPQGDQFGGAAALRYLSRRLIPLWPLMPLLHIPGSLGLWQWCYRAVARRRYQLAGKATCDSDTCAIHFAPAPDSDSHRASAKVANPSPK